MVEHTDRDPNMVPEPDKEHMEHIEQRIKQLEDEVKGLKDRLSQLERGA